MASESAMLHVRIDGGLKDRATAALAAMGLTASDAVRLLFHRIASDQAFPLELKVPNALTREAMAEADQMLAARSQRFARGDSMLSELDREAG
ncbi:MAG TPA: type II toxin-antitoxin system RelB/DinJ family antitoxin [Caulobacteraceae bacterium]|jgi:DNA-damage-inducible protein J|nr:type II toxin-antitoxin system RelB/DinJ family antitoxin [Caulobacteraceae bacterium]